MENSKEINAAIKTLVEKISINSSQDEALKYTQAALNLAHVMLTMSQPDISSK